MSSKYSCTQPASLACGPAWVAVQGAQACGQSRRSTVVPSGNWWSKSRCNNTPMGPQKDVPRGVVSLGLCVSSFQNDGPKNTPELRVEPRCCSFPLALPLPPAASPVRPGFSCARPWGATQEPLQHHSFLRPHPQAAVRETLFLYVS